MCAILIFLTKFCKYRSDKYVKNMTGILEKIPTSQKQNKKGIYRNGNTPSIDQK